MFLPNSLPTTLLKLRQKTRLVNKPSKINNNQFAVRLEVMVSLGKKRNNASATNKTAVASSSSKISPNRSLLTRGWERISRRKKRAKQITQSPLDPVTNETREPSTSTAFPNAWKTTLSNGSRLEAIKQNLQEEHQHNEQNRGRNGSPNEGVVVLPDTHSIAEEEVARRHFFHRGMDRIRRSFRRGTSSTKKGQALTGGRAAQAEQPSFSAGSSLNGGGLSSDSQHTGKKYCQPDEAAVRSAACSFNVKYLGSCEVYESRGMHVCEGALQHLRAKKRSTKCILYVSGDGIRLVDQDNNRGGLILDQTIEKVSFCAPDRHNDKGFAYICRDGATRRWMCHGFQATKESGERLSHAVGCAFNVCLEKKRKRDAETAAYKNAQALAAASSNGADTSGLNVDWDSVEPVGSAARNNAAYSSFRRQLSIAERKLDPQTAIIHNPPPPASTPQHPTGTQHALPSQTSRQSLTLSNQIGFNSSFSMDECCSSVAKPRPVANPLLFERQGSFKAPVQPSFQSFSSFKRFNSLRGGFDFSSECQDMSGSQVTNLTCDGLNKMLNGVKTLHNEPIYEGDDDEAEELHNQQTLHTNLRPTTSLAPRNIAPINSVTTWNVSKACPLPSSVSLQNFGTAHTSSLQQSFISPLWSTSITTTPTQNANVQKKEQGNGTDRSARLMHTSVSLTGFDDGFAHWIESPIAACTSQSSKADDWLEQAFKASITFPSPSHSNVHQQQQHKNQSDLETFAASQKKSLSSDAFNGPPLNPPPPLPTQQINFKNDFVPCERDQLLANLNNPQKLALSSNQGHSRKASGGAVRLSIEYQILEETDAPPQSPPSSPKSLSFQMPSLQVEAYTPEKPSTSKSPYSTSIKPKRSMQERTVYGEDDPFDVHWSTIVLQNSSSRKHNHCSSPPSSIRHSSSHNSLPSTSNGGLSNGVTKEGSLTPTTSIHTNPFSAKSTPVNT